MQYEFRRTLLINPADTYNYLIAGIPNIKDCKVADAGNPIRIERKRNIMANRWAMKAAALCEGQVLTVTVDGAGSAHRKFADEIFETLPEGAIEDHGLAAAMANMAKSERFFSFMELKNLIDDFRDGENVLMLASGQVDGKVGLIIVTSDRIMTKDKGAFVDSSVREILPKHVTSISTGKKMSGESLKLTVSGEKIEFSTLQHGRGDQIAEHIRVLRDTHSAPVPPAAAPAPAQSAGVGDLKQLAELHASGVLTDEEFAAAKAKALGL